MTAAGVANPDRLYELLADAAMQGLEPDEQRELDQLLLDADEPDAADSFALTAAALDLAFTSTDDIDPMPDGIRSQIAKTIAPAPTRAARQPSPERTVAGRVGPDQSAPSMSVVARTGWLLAAASLALAAIAWWPSSPADVASDRNALIASATDIIRWDWASAGELEGSGVTGDVVWSNAQQRGYMRFAGLAINDPTIEQYQLWIFDGDRSSEYPVDGGVFDATSGELIVPIDSKLAIRRTPGLFAITIEEPGGVVRSDRSRLVLLARAPQG